MSKVINISDELYERLKTLKESSSFDSLIRELIGMPPGRKPGWYGPPRPPKPPFDPDSRKRFPELDKLQVGQSFRINVERSEALNWGVIGWDAIHAAIGRAERRIRAKFYLDIRTRHVDVIRLK